MNDIAQLKEKQMNMEEPIFEFLEKKNGRLSGREKQTRIYEYSLHWKKNRINVIRSICFEVEEHQYCKITRRKRKRF
jgi:hypothetical protein